MSLFRTSPDLAVSKTDSYTFSATFVTSSGTPTIDFGDGNTQTSLTPSNAYGTGNPWLINITSDPKLITDITISGENLVACGLDRFVNVDTVDLSNNSLDNKNIERVLVALDNNGQNNGSLDLSNNSFVAPLSSTAVSAGQSLVAKGWTITGIEWDPSFLGDDLFAWYDASDTSTVTESSGNVSQWDDKSGNDYHLVQLTGSNQPNSYGTYTENSLNVMRTSFQDYIEKTDFGGIAFSGGIMLATITKDISGTGVWEDHVYLEGGVSSEILKVRRQSTNTRLSYSYGLDGTSGSVDGTTGTFPDDTMNIVTQGHDSGTWSGYVDGDLDKTASISGTFDLTQLRVGWRSNGGPDIRTGEVLVVEDFSTSTRQKVEGYLAHKWGRESALDAGHPYKSNPPSAFD
jgi:hypothetical protein